MALPIVCQPRKYRGAVALFWLAAVACARTGLEPGTDAGEVSVEEPGSTSHSTGGASAAAGQTGGASTAAGQAGGGAGGVLLTSGAAGMPLAIAGAPTQPIEQPPKCEPRAETCNGRDDDCNGAIDDLPAEPCPGGGFRFCVAGRVSECPRRCDVCVPGSVRICQNSFCSFWGEQECAADGQGFGHCREVAAPPAECKGVARQFEDSRELEQCCVDNGYCCLDEYDLDGDGNRHEMLGVCGDVVCQ